MPTPDALPHADTLTHTRAPLSPDHQWPVFCTPPQRVWPQYTRPQYTGPQALPQSTLHFALTQFNVADFVIAEFAKQQVPLTSGIDQAVPKRQAEYLAGRLCARDALQALTGHSMIPSRNEDRSPQWPPGTTGAITHSHGIAAALVAPTSTYAGIGLDIEQLITDDKAQRLAEHILTPEEMTHWHQQWQAQPGPWLTRIFSLKEALFKALYPITGTRFYFQDAKLDHWEAATGEAQLTLLTDLSPQWHRGQIVTGQTITPERWPDYVFSRVLIKPYQD